MADEKLNSIQVQDFLTDFESTSTLTLLEEGGKEENELFQIAEARGILLKGSRDLAGFKTVYTFADKANGNKARLPKKVLLRALPGIVGKPVDIDHNRARVIGYYIDYKYIVKDESVVAYGIIFKSNFANEWKECQRLFREGKLTSSYEIWCPKSKRQYLPDGTYALTEQEVAGGAILFKTKPAFADAQVLELAKINEDDMVYASKYHCEDMIIKGEYICRNCGKCKHATTEVLEEAKLIGQPINPLSITPIGNKPVEVAPFAVSEQETKGKDVVGTKPRFVPPHSIASMEKEVACPKCSFKGIPNKKVVGDGTNTYTYQGSTEGQDRYTCPQCKADISVPFSNLKCANCSYIMDKPFITTANEVKCPECKAILNTKGETKYPPQHIDFKLACPGCSSRNWRINRTDTKNAEIACMSCNKAYNIGYQEDPKATVMSNMHFLHIGTTSCAQCSRPVSYSGSSKMNKYEMACGHCNLRFSHDITNDTIRRISSINEIEKPVCTKCHKLVDTVNKTDGKCSGCEKADYETKFTQPSDLQDIGQPRVNSPASNPALAKASLVEFNYKLNDTTDVVLEGKILNQNASTCILEVAGYEGIFVVQEKEILSTADELRDKSATKSEAKGEKEMEKNDELLTPPAETVAEKPVEASIEETIDDSYEEGFEVAKKLDADARNALSDKDFAVVIHKDGKTVRKYPLKDHAHVRNALSRLGQDAPKEGLKALGVAPESVRAKVLRRAKELNMHTLLERNDAESYDQDVNDDKKADEVSKKLIKSYDDSLVKQLKDKAETKMAQEEEEKESEVEQQKEEKENENKAELKGYQKPDVKDDADKLAKKLSEADLKAGKPDMNREVAGGAGQATTSVTGVRGSKEKADLKTGKPDYNPELADLKKPVKDEKHPELADEKKSVKNEKHTDVADLKGSVKDEKHTDVADLKKPVTEEKHTDVADLKKTVKDEKHTDVADLKNGKPCMNRNLANFDPQPGDDADTLAKKLATAKQCVARHLACVKASHKKLQVARKVSKASKDELHRECASQVEFYRANAEEINKRRKEVGDLETASQISDIDILDNAKFADLKLEKANLEVAKKGAVVGNKETDDGYAGDEHKRLRKEIDDKAFGRTPRKS